MKKLILAAAVTAALGATQASAALYTVSSNINQNGLTMDLTNYLPEIPGEPLTLAFSGTVDIDVSGSSYTINGGNVFLNGQMTISQPEDVILTFQNGTGTVSNNGLLLTSGYLDIVAAGVPYDTVDFSVNNINMTNTATFNVSCGFNCNQAVPLTGLPLGTGTVNGDGSITVSLLGLPGMPLADLNAVGAAVAGVTLFGFPALQFMGGTITFTPVPVPAAAWLFGTALVGLASVARKRTQA